VAAHRKFTLLPVVQGLDIVTDCRNGSITLCTRSLGDLTRLTQRQARYTAEWLQGQYYSWFIVQAATWLRQMNEHR
jgi:hypothetical protein